MSIQAVKPYINRRVRNDISREEKFRIFLQYRKSINPIASIQERFHCSESNAKIILKNNEDFVKELNKSYRSDIRFSVGRDGFIYSNFFNKKSGTILKRITPDNMLKKLIEIIRSK